MWNEPPFFGTDKKEIAFLIDPDKFDNSPSPLTGSLIEEFSPSYFFVGGSFLSSQSFDQTVRRLKQLYDLPVIIFPGDHTQISSQADALLFLSLLSGRNPEYLIGQQVKAAPGIKRSGIRVIPTAYLLIDGGKITTVQYVTQSLPLPADKPDLISATALAGQYMGMQAVYLETGSGARQTVPESVVREVKSQIDIPLIVGGGVGSKEKIQALWDAGANVVVIGTMLEKMLQ